MSSTLSKALLVVSCSFLAACGTTLPPLQTVEYVDLQRFMGDWYVIATIPTFIDQDAYNSVESYRLDDDGTVATTFTFRQGGFDGKKKIYTPRGFIRDTSSNAEWGMQFIWPIKGDFRITFLAEDYSRTVISRNKRDYVWIMARSPKISEAEYQQMLEHVRSSGYDLEQLQMVPQHWPEQQQGQASAVEGAL